MDELPEGFKVAERSPSGTYRIVPDRPVSLPHNRQQASFSASFWLFAGCVGFLGLLALAWYLA